MYFLGINNMHDASAVLVRDGLVVAAAEEERFVRRKHISGFPVNAIRYCLDEAGITINDLDAVGVSWKYWVLKQRVLTAVRALPGSFRRFQAKAQRGIGQMRHEWYELFIMRRLIEKEFGPGRFKLHSLGHHFCHAVSTFYASPFERAAILTVDGAGEDLTTMLSVGEGTRIRSLKKIKIPHSLGQFYAAFTGFLGFKMQADEYKMMGLASYGEPAYKEFIRKNILHLLPDGEFRVDPRYLDYHLARQGIFLPETTKLLGASRGKDDAVDKRHEDIATSAQGALEDGIFHLADYLHGLTKTDKLCIAGGVGYNCVANGKLLANSPFQNIFVQPAAGDSGAALGAALFLSHHYTGRGREQAMKDVYLGPGFSQAEYRRALDEKKLSYAEMPEEKLCAHVAREISEGKLVFWYQGRMEWGPRALGNRSLLADPRRDEMKDTINAVIKQREMFRPFAPSVLEERSYEYFGNRQPSPFMLFTFPVSAAKRNEIPAVTHVDGTARPQTVSRETNPRYWRLIKEFEGITGVPILLNTSFNVQEPIVCTPGEAIHCFLRTKADYLVLGDLVVRRTDVAA